MEDPVFARTLFLSSKKEDSALDFDKNHGGIFL
jgi:hypothetical protein